MTEDRREETTEQTFANALAVHNHLKAGGWKIGRSLFYKHCNERLLRPRNGVFYLSDVLKYTRRAQLKNNNGAAVSETDRVYDEKNQAELDIAKEKLEQLRHKNQVAKGLYVPRDYFERELAQRAMIFKTDIESFCRAQAGVIVGLSGGDKDRVPDVIEYMLAASAAWLNRYAADREFVVPTVAQEDLLADPEEDEENDD